MPPAATVWFGDFRIDLADERLWRGPEALPLSPKAFALLRHLLAHAGQLVTKQALFDAVWPDTAVGDSVLTVAIGELRRVLGDDARAPRFIETVHRRGYRFLPAIRSSLTPPPSPQSDTDGARWPVESSVAASLTPPSTSGLVGREEEMRELRACLERSLQGDRQIAFVTGEPGIGKTALVTAFLQQVGQSSECWIGEGQCIEHYGAGEPYLPLFGALHQVCRAPGRSRLREILGQYAPSWLVQMPGLLDAATLETLARRTQGATRDRMLREMAEAVEAVTAEQPVVVLLEDLHWSDHATVDLLSFLARRHQTARLLVIGTYRPADVVAREHPVASVKDDLALRGLCRDLPLGRLSGADVGRYLAEALPGHRVPDGLVSRLHERTSGNPLFLVNVVQDWITQGVLVEVDGHWELGKDVEEAAHGVPRSVRQLIDRQLMRLSAEDQRLLGAASVAGEEFSEALVAEEGAGESEERCEALVRQHILRSRGTMEWPDGTLAGRYAFTHALYQEVLYERVPAGRRVQLHRRIARRLEAAFGAHTEDVAPELAAHFERGQEFEQAVPYLEKAARRVLRRSAPQQAVQHLERALGMLQALPDTVERSRRELSLLTTLGQAQNAINGYAAPDVERAYRRARQLCEQIGLSRELAPVLFGLWGVHLLRAEHRAARDVADELQKLVRQGEQDVGLQMLAHGAMGATMLWTGEIADARAELEREIALYDPQRHRSRFSYGVDPWVASHGYAALALWLLGFVDQSAQASEEAVVYARELGHPLSIAFSLHFGASLFIARREPRAVEQRAEALIALSSDLGLAFWGNQGTVARGQALIQRGHSAEGLAQVQGVLDTWSTLGKALNRPNYLAAMAEAYAGMGQVERGIDILDAAQAEIVRTGERWWEPEIHRLKGDLILKSRSVGGRHKLQAWAQAEACLQRAVEVARRQGARSLELRAAVSLSRLWLSQGERERAHALLQETYSWFTEGFDTADLQDARAVLTSCEAAQERGTAAPPRSKARGAVKPDPPRNLSRRRSPG